MKPVIFFDWDGTIVDSMDLCVQGVLVTMRQRRVGLLLFPVNENGKVRAHDAALLARLKCERDAGDADLVQRRDDRRPIRAELQQGGAEHIARRAHG